MHWYTQGALVYTSQVPKLRDANAPLLAVQGREILQNTEDLVQSSLNLEVIYGGDTDPIMINTRLEDRAELLTMGRKIKQEVGDTACSSAACGGHWHWHWPSCPKPALVAVS